jgi:predicted transcriptional regulator
MLARYLLLAFQHFYWLMMVVLAPFMILASLFESASGVTKSLFKNMFQIAAWPIIWSILSAFLKAIPFASIYATEGGLLTVVTLNLIIAVALLFSPFIVSQLCDGVSLSVGDTLRKGALKAVAIANPKAAVIAQKAERFEKFNQARKVINK